MTNSRGETDPDKHPPEQYVTYAHAGRSSDLDQRLQWLFNHPTLQLIEAKDEFADGMGPDANWDVLRYYGGLELRDPASQKALQIIVSEGGSDFTLDLKIQD